MSFNLLDKQLIVWLLWPFFRTHTYKTSSKTTNGKSPVTEIELEKLIICGNIYYKKFEQTVGFIKRKTLWLITADNTCNL